MDDNLNAMLAALKGDPNQPVLGVPVQRPQPPPDFMMQQMHQSPSEPSQGAVVFRPHMPIDLNLRSLFNAFSRNRR